MATVDESGKDPAGSGDGPAVTRRAPGRDDVRLGRGSEAAWSDTDVWFSEQWSLRSARRRMASTLLMVGVFAAGVVTHSAWNKMRPYEAINSQSAGVLELDDPEFLRVAGFVKRNYSPTTDAGALASRVAFVQSEHAAQMAVDWLGIMPVHVPKESDSISMLGLGKSQMPGGGRSLHYRYAVRRPEAPEVMRTVSVFVQQEDEKVKTLQEGKTYLLISGDTPLRIWRKDGLVYYVLGESRWANTMVTSAMGVPDASEALRATPKSLEAIGDSPGDGKD